MQTLAMQNVERLLHIKSKKVVRSSSKQRISPYSQKQKYEARPQDIIFKKTVANERIKLRLDVNRTAHHQETQPKHYMRRTMSPSGQKGGLKRWLQLQQITSNQNVLKQLQQQNNLFRESFNAAVEARGRSESCHFIKKCFQQEIEQFEELRLQYFKQVALKNEEINLLVQKCSRLQRENHKLEEQISQWERRYNFVQKELEQFKIMHDRGQIMEQPTQRNTSIKGETRNNQNLEVLISKKQFECSAQLKKPKDSFNCCPSIQVVGVNQPQQYIQETVKQSQPQRERFSCRIDEKRLTEERTITQSEEAGVQCETTKQKSILVNRQKEGQLNKIAEQQLRDIIEKQLREILERQLQQITEKQLRDLLERQLQEITERKRRTHTINEPQNIPEQVKKKPQKVRKGQLLRSHKSFRPRFSERSIESNVGTDEQDLQIKYQRSPRQLSVKNLILSKCAQEFSKTTPQANALVTHKEKQISKSCIQKSGDTQISDLFYETFKKPFATSLQSSKVGLPNEKNEKQTKIDLAKTFLKLKHRDSLRTISFKLKEKGFDNRFTMTVMDMLNLIRRSLSYKFKGFKYHFHMFQNDLIETEGFQISKDKIINRLKQYPFFMDDNNIEGLLEYVFSQDRGRKRLLHPGNQQEDSNTILTDKFCSKMREFVIDYDEISEEEEAVAIQQTQKKIFSIMPELWQAFAKREIAQGIIEQKYFVEVLEQKKFTQTEIELLLSQCCVISVDINHLAYQQYFSIYEVGE